MTDAEQVSEGEGGRHRCKSQLFLSPLLKTWQDLGFIPGGHTEVSGWENPLFAQLHI